MFYDYNDFTKADRKLFSDLIVQGAKSEIRLFLQKALPIHQSILETEQEDIRTPFWKLNDSFKDFSKQLTRRYDRYGHREITTIITSLLLDGVLTDEDLKPFSDDGKAKFAEMQEQMKNRRK